MAIVAEGDGVEVGRWQERAFYWGANSMQFLDSIWGFDTTCPDESFLWLLDGEEDNDDFEEEDDEDYSDDEDEETEEDDFEADDDDFMDDDDEDDDNEEESV